MGFDFIERIERCEMRINPDRSECVTCSSDSAVPDPIFDLCRAKRFDEALEICRAGIAEKPMDALSYRQMGDVLHSMKKLPEALSYRNKVVELAPTCVTSYFSRADLLYDMGDYAAAIADFTHAIEVDHNRDFEPINLLYRADCYRHLGEYDKAMADCALVPDDFGFPGFLRQREGTKHHLLAEIARERGQS